MVIFILFALLLVEIGNFALRISDRRRKPVERRLFETPLSQKPDTPPTTIPAPSPRPRRRPFIPVYE